MAGDVIDQAQRTQQMILDSALASRPTTRLTRSRTHCAECGEAIPKARQEAVPGCQFCKSCQEELENG